MLEFSRSALFRSDSLSWVMAVLIVFVAANVSAFSVRYLAGDRKRSLHLALVCLLAVSVLTMAFADHLLVLLMSWGLSNLLLTRLMMHKTEWTAARNSGLIAAKTFGIGFLFLLAGFWLVSDAAGSPYVHEIVASTETASDEMKLGLLLISLAALTQSAAWPFHRWLISSLNSPTPVSALMHAGLVNGGGFLLVRFSPLLLEQPGILHFLFLAGLVTAVTGTFWKLLQTDIKRMLACSTMGQMGFMIMQCGMGLFAPAVSHLCWHGLFKAYSFLNSGSVIREKRLDRTAGVVTFGRFLAACPAGVIGAWAFAWTSHIPFDLADTGCLMTGIAFMAATQIALRTPEFPGSMPRFVTIPVMGLIAGGSYGASVALIESILEPLGLNQAQPLDFVYSTGFGTLMLVWLAMNFDLAGKMQSTVLWKRLYVAALNASQPHPKTVTANRSNYGI
ncbi:proton-conducting membrane transporter [bacterium]|nr:proton-conducting membrane transporter [bacterium]